MGDGLLNCSCGAMFDNPSDVMRCKACSKIYHLSCPLSKGCIRQSVRSPSIRILNCNKCSETTRISVYIESDERDALNTSHSNPASNSGDLKTCSDSAERGVPLKNSDSLHQDVSSNKNQPVSSSNHGKPSDGDDPKKNCDLCGQRVSKQSKVLECKECQKVYHYACAAYSPEKLQELFEKNGWICINCFISVDGVKKEEKCNKCEKTISEESKKLKCRRCINVYHHKCGAYASGEVQELLEKNGWLCNKCAFCDEKTQICAECQKPVTQKEKILDCNMCKKCFHYQCVAYAPREFQKWFEKNGWKCKNCLIIDDDSQEDKPAWKRYAKNAAIGVGFTAARLGGIPLAVGAIGFGAAEVAGGSLAAAYQRAFLAGCIAARSTFSVLQIVGAVGLAETTKARIAAACAGLPSFMRDISRKKQ